MLIKKLGKAAVTGMLVLSLFMLGSNSNVQASANNTGASASVTNQTSSSVLGTSVLSFLGLSTQIGL